MAIRSVATTDTLETFRTTFNSLAGTDIGDNTSLSTTERGSIVGAINEINTSLTATGWTVTDGSNSQTIVSGNSLTIVGTTGINAVVSATDTLTLSLENMYPEVAGATFNADGSNAYTNLAVTVAAKTSAHIYNGTGSSNGFKIDGTFSPFLNFKVGNTYRFDQADSSNTGHPLRFYYDAAKVTAYTTGVTDSGTPGNAGAYTQIVITSSTPNILYYQCSSHAHMGSRVDVDSSTIIGATFLSSTGTTISYATNAFAIAQAVALG